MAPEVLQGNYNEKCDIWSCGVIMYMLLSGRPPFFGNSNEEIFTRIMHGHYSFSCSDWKNISETAIKLIKKMLTYNPKMRISAKEALNNAWFKLYENNDAKKRTILEGVKCLKTFKTNSVMQRAVLSYISAHAINKGEEKKLREIFNCLDKDKDGLLSLEELAEGYLLLFNGDEKSAKEEAKRTMDEIDTNKNGTVDYNGKYVLLLIEFLAANLKKNDCINKDKLKQAFDFFDADHNGTISETELERVFIGIKNKDTLKEVIKEIDVDNDGQVNCINNNRFHLGSS